MSQAEDPDLTRETDAVLGRADAFMRRRRSVPEQNHVDDDIPLLTDIVPLRMPRSVLDELSDPAVFQRPYRGPEVEALQERALDASLQSFQAAAPEPEPALDPILEPELASEPEIGPELEPEAEPALELQLGREAELDVEAEPEWAEEEEPAADTEAASQIEVLVAARLQEVLGTQRQEMAIVLDDWLNYDLPRLVSREIDGIADRIVKIAGEELRILLQAGLPPEE